MRYQLGIFLLIASLPSVATQQFGLQAKLPALVGGTVVDPALYPDLVWIGHCTANAVGPRTVMTAAHCIPASGPVTFTAGLRSYTAQCVSSREYPRNPTADYAYCYTSAVIQGVPYMPVNIDPTHTALGDYVLQTGYGCKEWLEDRTEIDGELRVGLAQLIQLPSGHDNDYVTSNGSVLCSGDSGGGAFSLTANGDRDRLISVNSRSDKENLGFLSSTSSAEGSRSLRAYMARFGTEVCGVTTNMIGCRVPSLGSPLNPLARNLVDPLD